MSSPKSLSVSSEKTLKCGICRADIVDKSFIYQSKSYGALICQDCCNMFSKEDIELILDLFIAYGGYFGKLKPSDFSLVLMLDKLEKKDGRATAPFEKLTVIFFHNALLHGISPQEYINQLEALIDNLFF